MILVKGRKKKGVFLLQGGERIVCAGSDSLFEEKKKGERTASFLFVEGGPGEEGVPPKNKATYSTTREEKKKGGILNFTRL